MRNEKGQFVKGSSGFTGTHTEEAKKKIRIARARQGSNVWNKGTNLSSTKGKPRSEETKRKLKMIMNSPKVRNRISKALRGENNPNWKGGVTPVAMRIRSHFKYRQWRSDVFTRDDFTCQLCGKRGGGILNADHFPKRFSAILEEYEIKSIESALDCEELWNVNNGRTLCLSCHKKFNGKPKKRKTK